MASDDHRWQAATGAIAGSLVADAMLGDGARWSERAHASTEHAESLLSGRPMPIDVDVADAVPLAVGLSVGASPLLTDPATVELIEHVRRWLDTATVADFSDSVLAAAAGWARSTSGFVGAVEAAGGDRRFAVLTGALAGLEGGIGAIPARLVSTVRAPDGRRGRRYVSRLVDRLLGLHRIDWYEPRRRRGPREVLPGVWLSNIHGLGAFTADRPDGLVLSLCDIEGRLEHHEHQITFHLDDTPKREANPRLAHVLDDALGEIRTAREAGQPVLVHCRHGASRTGLVLRLLLVEELGLDAEAALIEAQCLWPHTSTWNAAWNAEIERRCALR